MRSAIALLLLAVGLSSAFECSILFEKASYTGVYRNGNVTFDEGNVFTISSGYDRSISYQLQGEFSQYFTAQNLNDGKVRVILSRSLLIRDDIRLILRAVRNEDDIDGKTVLLIGPEAESQSCQISGVSAAEWTNGLNIDIIDTASGSTFSGVTSNIIYIADYKPIEHVLNNAPYISVSLTGSQLNLNLVDKFKYFEVYESSRRMTYEITFNCTQGTRKLTVRYNIRDTNNYTPVFLPRNAYTYSIVPPVPRGFPVSFVSDIIVRDNDMTNYEIVPQIEPNEFFELVYSGVDSSRKNYKLALRAKVPIEDFTNGTYVILATDRDLTGFPAQSAIGRINVVKDETFGCFD